MNHCAYPWSSSNKVIPKIYVMIILFNTDFEAQNSGITTGSHRMEGMKDIFHLFPQRPFSTFDLKDGYFQIESEKE